MTGLLNRVVITLGSDDLYLGFARRALNLALSDTGNRRFADNDDDTRDYFPLSSVLFPLRTPFWTKRMGKNCNGRFYVAITSFVSIGTILCFFFLICSGEDFEKMALLNHIAFIEDDQDGFGNG
ncbi:hypothetical protein BaRGS_00034954 [Batillaria attramentaria]|uniref:Uncharacterized protein n=1 Tax=Batillaria attramentaria TaxID=370345 RepID=A0ABD0JFU7_9CAEN